MEEKIIDRETIVLLKTLDSVKDLIAIFESVLDRPSEAQIRIMKRKLSIIKNKLPKTSNEIKVIAKRKDTKLLTFEDLDQKTII